MKRESFILLIDVYQDIRKGIHEALQLLVGDSIGGVGYNEGFLGRLTRVEKIIRDECHPSFLECDADGGAFYMNVLDDEKLSSAEQADILMFPRNGKVY